MSNHSESLQLVLVDTYALYLKTQNYHWNVEGKYFQSLHTLFESQYDELAEAVDEIAERIRALGAKVDANFTSFAKRKTVSDANSTLDEAGMVSDLLAGHRAVIATATNALKQAEEASDPFTVDLLTSRIGAHEKAGWMLRSSLPEAARTAESPAADYASAKRTVKQIA